MSALSMNATSMASVMLLVVSSMTLGKFLRESKAVSKALTALTASAGSEPETAALLAAVKDSTCSSYIFSVPESKTFPGLMHGSCHKKLQRKDISLFSESWCCVFWLRSRLLLG